MWWCPRSLGAFNCSLLYLQEVCAHLLACWRGSSQISVESSCSTSAIVAYSVQIAVLLSWGGRSNEILVDIAVVLVGSADTEWLHNWISDDILLIEEAGITEIKLVYVGVRSGARHAGWHAILLAWGIVDIERVCIWGAAKSIALKACTDGARMAVFEVSGGTDPASCIVPLILRRRIEQ